MNDSFNPLSCILDLKLYHGESWELLIRRWAKLEKDYKLKNGNYDISKIPDIYDCIKYDLQHNQKTLLFDRAEELFMCSKALADIVIPQVSGDIYSAYSKQMSNYRMIIDKEINTTICIPFW